MNDAPKSRLDPDANPGATPRWLYRAIKVLLILLAIGGGLAVLAFGTCLLIMANSK